MLLRKLSSKKALPAGMACVICGLMLVVVSNAIGQLPHLSAHGSFDERDFLRGFLIGIGIVAELAGIVLLTRARREDGRASQ